MTFWNICEVPQGLGVVAGAGGLLEKRDVYIYSVVIVRL